MTEPRAGITVIRNVVYNPSWPLNALQMVCDAQANDGYALLRVVPVSQYETVAVFERTITGRCCDNGMFGDDHDCQKQPAESAGSMHPMPDPYEEARRRSAARGLEGEHIG